MARLTLARQDRGHYVNTLEEGGTFRRRTTEDRKQLEHRIEPR